MSIKKLHDINDIIEYLLNYFQHRTDYQRPLQPSAELRDRSQPWVRGQRQQRRVHRQRVQQPLRPHQELLQVRIHVCWLIIRWISMGKAQKKFF